jgi:hypothetical protein
MVMDPKDIETLAYIHSNKFITPRIFHRKFHPNHTFWGACLHLRRLVTAGLLLKTEGLPNEDTCYSLTRPALHYLSSIARVLLPREVRSPHINRMELEHDKRVMALRVQIEQVGALGDLTWVSDYEMRCGLKMGWKVALDTGRGWDLAGTKLRRLNRRTPDGYFEGTIGETSYSFVLEYEHSPYNRDQITSMVLNLHRDFPQAYRLVVCRDKPRALRMLDGVSHMVVSGLERPRWVFSFFEMVDRLPFTQVPWVSLEEKYPPFVKDPILMLPPIGKPVEATATEATA